MNSLIATARSNKVSTCLGIQDFSQVRKGYGCELVDVIIKHHRKQYCRAGVNDSLKINNLFGVTSNTDFIKHEIETNVNSKLGNFEKLLAIIGNNLYSDRFKRGFDNATKTVQESIIAHFQIAKDRKGATNFYSDEELIKDVTPEKEAKVKVYELRIFSPVAYRVYFHEIEQKVYLAIIEKKPAKKVQNTHITSSKDIIKELVIKESIA